MIAAANTGAARSAIVTVTAAGISGSPKTIAVYQAAPAGLALVDLTPTVRSLLGGPATTEISDAQLAICWRRAVDEYSKYRPIREYYYGAGVVLVADQTAYSVPDETFDIKACRIYATLQEVKDNLKYFEDYQEAGPGLTGYGSFYWSFNNNKMELSDIPAAADAGKFIGMLIYKGHVFTAGTCTTIPRKEFEGHLLNWCKGDALETWAGYQGSVRFGSSSEDREPLRDEARKLKEAAVKFWSTVIIL
jgi:hypothetical protein